MVGRFFLGGAGGRAYVVGDGVELGGGESVKVLVDVLVGEVAAEEDAADLAVGVGELREGAGGFAFVEELVQAWDGQRR